MNNPNPIIDRQDKRGTQSVPTGSVETTVVQFQTLRGSEGEIRHVGNDIAPGYADNITWNLYIDGVVHPDYKDYKGQWAELWRDISIDPALPVGQGKDVKVTAKNDHATDAVRCDARVVAVYRDFKR